MSLFAGNAAAGAAFPAPLASSAMELDAAIRTRRTHKAYGPEPVPRGVLDELFELARWAPNHNLTNPWRFRVLGPEALAALKEAAGPEAATKLDRAPTLVVASAIQCGDTIQDEEDLCAAACAVYAVLLGAHARGLAGYWRTPSVLRTPEGRAALGIGAGRAGPRAHPPRPAAPGARGAGAGAGRRLRNVPGVIPREDALAAFGSDRFDMVVVGGGITGAGVALDAASRGYSVALVERQDYASGTSSRSSKLVHGGLRYLQNFDLGLVREALLERAIMVNLAPHLVHPLALRDPDVRGQGARAHARRRPARVRRDGDRPHPAPEPAPPRARTRTSRRGARSATGSIDGDEVTRLLPALAAREPTAGYLFYDCQTDDVRLVLTVLGEAERYGAVMANRCSVLELIEEDGRADGVRCRDERGGERVRDPRRQRRQRDRRVGRPDPLRGGARRGGGAADPPEPRHARHALAGEPADRLPARSSPPAAAGRSSRSRGSAARWSARPTTTTRAGSTTSRPTTGTSSTCSTRATTSSAARSRAPT